MTTKRMKRAGRMAAKWQCLSESSEVFAPRFRAARAVHGDLVYLYGGFADISEKKCYGDLCMYDLRSQTWSRVECTGSSPGEIAGGEMQFLGDKLYHFGGFTGHEFIACLFCLDLVTKTWRMVQPLGEVPSPRSGCASWVYEGRLHIWGGCNHPTYFSDLFVFDVTTERWSNGTQPGVIPSVQFYTGTFQSGHHVYITRGDVGRHLTDDRLWRYDMNTCAWKLIICRGDAPSTGLFRHHSVLTGNQLLIFGGYVDEKRTDQLHGFDLSSKIWKEILPTETGMTPSPRSSGVMVAIGETVLLIGGRAGNKALNDVWTLELVEQEDFGCGRLCQDQAQLVDNPVYHDVVFALEDGSTVGSVAAVMAARSAFFHTLLFGNWSTKRDTPIPLPELERRTLVSVLEYVFTAETEPLNVEDALLLLHASGRFMMGRGLENLCSEFIGSHLTTENAVGLLLQAGAFKQVKESCMKFIVSNFDAVKQLEQFQELKQDPDLLMELTRRLK